jgi:hypothetical protein
MDTGDDNSRVPHGHIGQDDSFVQHSAQAVEEKEEVATLVVGVEDSGDENKQDTYEEPMDWEAEQAEQAEDHPREESLAVGCFLVELFVECDVWMETSFEVHVASYHAHVDFDGHAQVYVVEI